MISDRLHGATDADILLMFLWVGIFSAVMVAACMISDRRAKFKSDEREAAIREAAKTHRDYDN